MSREPQERATAIRRLRRVVNSVQQAELGIVIVIAGAKNLGDRRTIITMTTHDIMIPNTYADGWKTN